MGTMIMPAWVDYRGLDADIRACLEAVAGFADVEIARRWRGPEHPLTLADFTAIAQAADACGLLDSTTDGCGIWSDIPRGSDTAFSVQALRCIARHHTAAALHLHGLALARVAGLMAGVADVGVGTVFSFSGCGGLGRSALMRWLSAVALSPADVGLLEDVYGQRERVLFVADAAAGIMVPMFTQGRMQLALFATDDAVARVDAQPHGLDGLQALVWRPCAAPLCSLPVVANQIASLLAAFQLGLVAIAL